MRAARRGWIWRRKTGYRIPALCEPASTNGPEADNSERRTAQGTTETAHRTRTTHGAAERRGARDLRTALTTGGRAVPVPCVVQLSVRRLPCCSFPTTINRDDPRSW